MTINPEAFQESITKELEVVKDRVRNLIGAAHWGEEGRYKEAILLNVVRRFLSSDLSAGTGFIVKSETNNQLERQITVSKQIDIIVYDNRIPVLFSEGNFIITSDRNVRAVIEVKTRIENNQLENILRTAMLNAKIINSDIFNGIFAFEYEKRDFPRRLKEVLEALGNDGKYINHLSLGPCIFVKYWEETNENVASNGCKTFYGIYDFSSNTNTSKRLSFSYFISNLIYKVSKQSLSDRLWLLFPVEGGKERYRKETACLERRM